MPFTCLGYGLTLPKTKSQTRKIVTASEVEVPFSGHESVGVNA